MAPPPRLAYSVRITGAGMAGWLVLRRFSVEPVHTSGRCEAHRPARRRGRPGVAGVSRRGRNCRVIHEPYQDFSLGLRGGLFGSLRVGEASLLIGGVERVAQV